MTTSRELIRDRILEEAEKAPVLQRWCGLGDAFHQEVMSMVEEGIIEPIKKLPAVRRSTVAYRINPEWLGESDDDSE